MLTPERYINPYTLTERCQYEESRKDMWDYFSTMKTAVDKGRAEGRAEGRDERTLEIARNLKAMNYSNEDIAKATGLSIDEICQL